MSLVYPVYAAFRRRSQIATRSLALLKHRNPMALCRTAGPVEIYCVPITPLLLFCSCAADIYIYTDFQRNQEEFNYITVPTIIQYNIYNYAGDIWSFGALLLVW